METMVEIINCSKSFGEKKAVKDISFSVEEGEIFGLMGSNGSGKSILLKMTATLIPLSAGEIRLGGFSVEKEKRQVRRIMGYMPDEFGIYPEMKVGKYLDYFASCYSIGKDERQQIIGDLLELVDLTALTETKLKELSKGMLQRLSFARMLVHDPKILILDEPAAGVDGLFRVEMMELLTEMAKTGKTVIIASHNLADISNICQRIGWMQGGEMAWVGDKETLQSQLNKQQKLKVSILEGLDKTIKILEKIPVIKNIQTVPGLTTGSSILEMDFSGDETVQSQILGYLTKFGIPVVDFGREQKDLSSTLSMTGSQPQENGSEIDA